MITFVVNLCQIPKKTEQIIVKMICSLKPDLGFELILECLEELYLTAKYYHPDCNFVVLSDQHSDLKLPDGIELIRYDLDVTKFTLSRQYAYAEFLKEKRDSNVIFIDPDMLIQANLDSIFDTRFDVGLTFVPPTHKNYILSGALIFVPRGSHEKARDYIMATIKIIESLIDNKHVWYGGQEAIIKYFKSNKIIIPKLLIENRLKETLIETDNKRFLLLPGYKYNWTIKKSCKNVRKPAIVHFKGARKALMKPYFCRYFPQLIAHHKENGKEN